MKWPKIVLLLTIIINNIVYQVFGADVYHISRDISFVIILLLFIAQSVHQKNKAYTKLSIGLLLIYCVVLAIK